MTATSIDFFPCRVQLMGLPPSSATIAAASTPVRPPIAKTSHLCRNLFGSPDSGEMKFLYQQEAERSRLYVLQRYNLDIQTCTNLDTIQTTINPETQHTQLPTLIEKELRQHAERLHDEKHLSNKSPSESTHTKDKISNYGNRCFKIARSCNKPSSILSPAVERQKPYSRQPLLKESFNIRKKRDFMKTSDDHCIHEAFTFKNSALSKLRQRTCDLQNIGNESSTCTNIIYQQHAQIERNRSPTISCDDNSTKFSLQFVVSMQNPS